MRAIMTALTVLAIAVSILQLERGRAGLTSPPENTDLQMPGAPLGNFHSIRDTTPGIKGAGLSQL
jgi:hypothetical protein